MVLEALVMSIHVHTFKVRVGAYYKNMRPCVEAEVGGGDSEQNGRGFIWAKSGVRSSYPCTEHCEI